MRQFFSLLAGLIAIGGAVPYILDTLKGKTHPNIVTWLTWTLLNGINGAAAFSAGELQTAIFSFCATLATAAILILGLRNGIKKYTRFDAVCQTIALAGIPVWLLTSQPALAVLIVVLVDFSGGLPTLRHAWKAPHEETWQTFVASWVSSALLLASLASYNFVAVALPLYILIFETVILATLFYRRRAVRVA